MRLRRKIFGGPSFPGLLKSVVGMHAQSGLAGERIIGKFGEAE